MKKEFKEIPLNQISVESNYRKTFDPALLNELAQSIKENGVDSPIIVRPNPKGGFFIVAGERRYRASLIAKVATIDAVVRDIPESEVLKKQLIENVQRAPVHYMEEAYALQRLRDEGSLDVAELAKLVGKSDSWVYQMLRLTSIHGEAQRLAANGFISKPVAMLISCLNSEEDQCKVANALARTHKNKLVDIRYARQYIEQNITADGRNRRTRRNAIQKANGNDYCANWKKYLVKFSSTQFEYWKALVRGRTDVPTLSEAVEQVMIGGGGRFIARFGLRLVWQ